MRGFLGISGREPREDTASATQSPPISLHEGVQPVQNRTLSSVL